MQTPFLTENLNQIDAWVRMIVIWAYRIVQPKQMPARPSSFICKDDIDKQETSLLIISVNVTIMIKRKYVTLPWSVYSQHTNTSIDIIS